MFQEEEIDSETVPVAALLTFGSPLHDDPWGAGVTADMVDMCLFDGDLYGPEPVPAGCTDPLVHAARIAWFCVHGWTDEIVFSAGAPSFGVAPAGWRFLDGNHRLAAAEMCGKTHVLVAIDGEVEAGMSELAAAASSWVETIEP